MVTYDHVELEHHAALLAEGLPAESYLDSGNRALFESEATTVIPLPGYALAVWAEKAYAPLTFEGERLVQARASLLRRAEAIGHATTFEPGLYVVAAGKVVTPRRDGDRFSFALPPGLHTVRLCSRQFVPAQLLPDSIDTRLLGVAVQRLEIDGQERDAQSDLGWYEAEAGLRWTDGDAEIVAPGRRLVVAVVPLGVYRAGTPVISPSREVARVA
jgi:hypothetical protein